MDFNLDVRLKQLESLEQYISSSRDKVQSIFDCLKWDEKEVLKDSQLIRCSVNRSHRVHSKSVDEHVKKCLLRKEGYDLNEDFLSEPVNDVNSSIVIDDHKKIELLSAAHRSIPNFKTDQNVIDVCTAWNGQDPDPKTANRLTCTFSPNERLALYSHAAQNTTGPPELPEFNTIQPTKSDKPLTYEELRMRERDAKRRRIKYKSVHTNHKSHKEVLREVIKGQMEMYTDWLVDNGLARSECDAKNESSPKREDQSYEEQQKSEHNSVTEFSERDHSVSRNSTHSGSSRSTVAKHSKDRYEFDRKRYDDRDYKKHYNSSSHEHSSYKRRKSRDRCEYRKYETSHSRRSHDNRRRYDGYKER